MNNTGTKMTKREKIIREFKRFIQEYERDIGCTSYDCEVLKGVHELLKAQEPRVMTDAELMEKIRKAPIIQKPAVDAIPVEWIKALMNHSDMFTRGAAKWVLGCWKKEKKEQEVR